jgi:hypothetical protein
VGIVTCAFADCAEVAACCLPGGCVRQRFGPQPVKPRTLKEADGLREDAPALNGTKPWASRDPRFIKRRRKALR